MEVLVIQSYEQALAFTIHFQPAIYGFLIKSILFLFKEERLGTEEDPAAALFFLLDYCQFEVWHNRVWQFVGLADLMKLLCS